MVQGKENIPLSLLVGRAALLLHTYVLVESYDYDIKKKMELQSRKDELLHCDGLGLRLASSCFKS